ncbi:MAG TPA: amidohydrolase, partial [Clostridia bacterium]|nr:amidohydrolase [Clostridia bacterium]
MKALKAKWLVLSSEEVKENTGFTFDDDKIIRILSNAEIDEIDTAGDLGEVIDATEEIVCPGFINSHMHQYGLVSHGMIPRTQIRNFDSFLADYWWPDIEDQIRKEDLIAGTYASAAELLHSG